MAETYTREALIGGDLDLWGTFEEAQNHIALGLVTSSLFLSGVTLYLGKGKIGIDNGSTKGVIDISADKSISVAALTASLWAKVEIAVVAGVPVITITSIAGETDPAILPASFTAAYDGSKGAHYITATKRCVGLVWINAAGAVEGIVNQVPGCDGYSGYATSDDANDVIHKFEKLNYTYISNQLPEQVVATSSSITLPVGRFVVLHTNGANNHTLTLTSSAANRGNPITIEKADSGAGIVTITPSSGTIGGRASWYLIVQYQTVRVVFDGTNFQIIGKSGIMPISLTTGDIDPANTNVVEIASFVTLKPYTWVFFNLHFTGVSANRTLKLWWDAAGTIPAPGTKATGDIAFTFFKGNIMVRLNSAEKLYYQVDNADVTVVNLTAYAFEM